MVKVNCSIKIIFDDNITFTAWQQLEGMAEK